MDLEHLTKHQIVLLTLLVSFVTSIATGIVTVSLMDQAPPSVERTINQIVERTVQTVEQPAAAVATPAAPATTKTVVVDQSDQVADSIAKVEQALVRIVDAKDPDTLVARGVIVDKSGTALTDRAAVEQDGGSLQAILPDGTYVDATIRKDQATTTGTIVLDLAVGTSTAFAPAALADASKVRLGESLVRIGGTGADSVGEGVVSIAPHNGLIEASVSSKTPGSVLMDVFGDVIGLMTGDSAAVDATSYSVALMPAAPALPPAPKPSS